MIPPRNEITVLHPLTHEQSVDVVERVMRVFEGCSVDFSREIGYRWCSERALQRGLDIEFGLTDMGEHDWFKPNERWKFESCRLCGIVKRRDGKNSACKGPVNVTLRQGDR